MAQPQSETVPGDAQWDPSILLRELPELVQRRKSIVIGSLVASIALGVSYLLFATPIYSVGARLLVQHRDLPLQEENRSTRSGKFLGTQGEIISSPAVIGTAMESVPFADFEGTEQERLAEVLETFQVTPVDGTNVLTLSYWSANPDEGTRLVDATIESYRRFVREADHTESQAIGILTKKEKELRAELNALKSRYEEFQGQKGGVGSNEQTMAASRSMLDRLAAELVEARSRRFELAARVEAERSTRRALLSSASGQDGSGDGASVSPVRPAGDQANPATAGLAESSQGIEQELWQARMSVNALAQTHGDAHPEMLEARQQVAMWEDRLRENLDSERVHLESELASARSAERGLNAQYNRELARIESLDVQQLEGRQLREEMERVRQSHQTMRNRLKQAELNLEASTVLGGGVLIRTLESPGLRVSKVWPNVVLVLGPCAFVGLIGGILLATIIDRARRGSA